LFGGAADVGEQIQQQIVAELPKGAPAHRITKITEIADLEIICVRPRRAVQCATKRSTGQKRKY